MTFSSSLNTMCQMESQVVWLQRFTCFHSELLLPHFLSPLPLPAYFAILASVFTCQLNIWNDLYFTFMTEAQFPNSIFKNMDVLVSVMEMLLSKCLALELELVQPLQKRKNNLFFQVLKMRTDLSLDGVDSACISRRCVTFTHRSLDFLLPSIQCHPSLFQWLSVKFHYSQKCIQSDHLYLFLFIPWSFWKM